MARIEKPEEIFEAFTRDIKTIYGDDLVSIALYGSAAGPDYRPGISDINFLVVLSEEAIDHLDRTMDVVARWRRKQVAVPLFMTRSYIESSLDAYPLEFLTMSRTHRPVYGEDVLAEITCAPEHLRLQCEREIKGKLLLLREGYLETGAKEKRIRELIASSITAFISIFSGLLFLTGHDIPSSKREIIDAVSRVITVDGTVFLRCLDVKEKKDGMSSTDISSLIKLYLMEVRKLWGIVDQMRIEEH